ncbi:MAG: polysaccharide deacetylase family protein [Actinomycetota bacterium]
MITRASRSDRVLVPHVDDVACSHSANRAMIELGRAGAVTCGSVMVPPSWFPELSRSPNLSEFDLGIHLTLTSESAAFRWRPISTTSPASGLIDDAGYMWSTVSALRRRAHPEAVETELRAQIDRGLAAGIDVTHLDHHMGAALAPEFVDVTVQIAVDYRLPLFFPTNLAGFLDSLEMGTVAVADLSRARAMAEPWAIGDTFLMGLSYQSEPDPADTFRRLLNDLGPGITYLSLHCSSPGDIEQIHPNDAAWRIGEYRLFSDPEFTGWLQGIGVKITGMRGFRDRTRASG